MIGSNVVTSNEKQPVAVTVITRAQMQLSGARNIAEALMAYIPNFFNNETQDNYIVGFRGLGPDNNSKVMLLLNGENLNNEFFWGPPDAVLSSLNFDYIERIEFRATNGRAFFPKMLRG
jgi:outer membrane receptor for ferrienterochelin and colicin